jgi:hypothetical protein
VKHEENAMKRKLFALFFILGLSAAQSAQALTEVITTIPAYWVDRDGSLTLYGTAPGPCGGYIFGVNKTLANYSEIYDAAVLAMKESYKMDLVVEDCDGNKNTVTFAKVCRDQAYC